MMMGFLSTKKMPTLLKLRKIFAGVNAGGYAYATIAKKMRIDIDQPVFWRKH